MISFTVMDFDAPPPKPDISDAIKLAQQYATNNPKHRFAYSKSGGAVGFWSEQLGRFYSCAMKAITGPWVHLEYECLINGEPPVNDWIELCPTNTTNS